MSAVEAATRTSGLRSMLRRNRQASERPAILAGRQYVTLAAFVVAVGVLAPMILTSRSDRYLTNLWLIYAMVGIGFYWMFGLAGRFAFSQTAMMALGGYLAAWAGRTFDSGSFLIDAGIAVLGCAAVAFVVGFALRRAQLFYFAIATLALSQIMFQVFRTAEGFTGPNGTVTGVGPVTLFGKSFVTDAELFWFLLGTLALVLVLGIFIERSPLRREAIAGRDNLMVARTSGVQAVRAQIALFVIGSALAGLSGALIASTSGVVGLESFGFDLSIGIFLMLFLGGAHSVWGPVLGAAVYVFLPEALSGIETYSTIIYGALLLVVIMVLPDGLVGFAHRVARWVSRLAQSWRRSS